MSAAGALQPLCPSLSTMVGELHGRWVTASPPGRCPREGQRSLDFRPRDCALRSMHASSLRHGRLMMVGDSLIRYQGLALMAWLARVGHPFHCTNVSQPSLPVGRGGSAGVQALRQLLHADRYEGQPFDCQSGTMRISIRRLNLLPPPQDLADYFDQLFAPLSHRDTVVLNVGLWLGQLARARAFKVALPGRAHRGTTAQAQRAAQSLFNASTDALARIACQRGRRWPRLLWREHLPQHFPHGGEYRHGADSARCVPLEEVGARQQYRRMVMPVREAIARHRGSTPQAGPSRRDRSSCPVGLRILPAFWPLVPRHSDHYQAGAGSSRRAADCTHFGWCSAAMRFLNQLTLHALGSAAQGTAHHATAKLPANRGAAGTRNRAATMGRFRWGQKVRMGQSSGASVTT